MGFLKGLWEETGSRAISVLRPHSPAVVCTTFWSQAAEGAQRSANCVGHQGYAASRSLSASPPLPP